MKRLTYYTFIITGIALASTLTSCNLYDKIFNKKNSETVKKEIVLPQDREEIMTPSDTKTYSPEEFAKGIIKGDWAIDKVFNQVVIGEKAAFIKFSTPEGRIYGNNGCNTINGDFSYEPTDSTITFSNVAVTMMLCHKEGLTDYLINQALNETARYSLEDVEDGYLMYLYNAEGSCIMELSHQNLDFLNGTWKVVEIRGEMIDSDKMKLVFDIDEHKVHGNTGCNILNGNLETDMDAPNTFSFESIAVTMMMCPQMEYQTAMLVALEDAERAKPINKNRVLLLNAAGEPVMALERTHDK